MDGRSVWPDSFEAARDALAGDRRRQADPPRPVHEPPAPAGDRRGRGPPAGLPVRAREGAGAGAVAGRAVGRRRAIGPAAAGGRVAGGRRADRPRAPQRAARRADRPRPARLPDHHHRLAAADDRGPPAARAARPRRARRAATTTPRWRGSSPTRSPGRSGWASTSSSTASSSAPTWSSTSPSRWTASTPRATAGSSPTEADASAPPILAAPPTIGEPMTVDEWRVAQAATDKPVKGMLTGPVTIVNWSFRPPGVPDDRLFWAVAQPIAEEVRNLVAAGARVIQVDEPAVRERWPLPDRGRAAPARDLRPRRSRGAQPRLRPAGPRPDAHAHVLRRLRRHRAAVVGRGRGRGVDRVQPLEGRLLHPPVLRALRRWPPPDRPGRLRRPFAAYAGRIGHERAPPPLPRVHGRGRPVGQPRLRPEDPRLGGDRAPAGRHGGRRSRAAAVLSEGSRTGSRWSRSTRPGCRT